MQLIGMLGGMSWQSSALYYRLMNEAVAERLGGLHSARVLLHSVDFQGIEKLQHEGDWQQLSDQLSTAAVGLRNGGADFIIIATNTMHKVADALEETCGLPVLHIVDPTGHALISDRRNKVGLLGTRFTMEEKFYRQRLETLFDVEVVVPEEPDRLDIHRIIYEELCVGTVTQQARNRFAACISALRERDCDSVILGCTEITMVVDTTNSTLPIYDTTGLHATAAVDRAIAAPKT